MNPFPLNLLESNSNTESLSPPVLKAITGVLPMKNSCWTIPPGSNKDGIIPKSEPALTKVPSDQTKIIYN